jgi:hypothetical protein
LSARAESAAGGIAEFNSGVIDESFSTGSITVGDSGWAGGVTAFIGGSSDTIVENSYAIGAVTGGSSSVIGGMIGEVPKNTTAESLSSYSTGAVSAGSGSLVGGFVGKSTSSANYSYAYWDVTTSGTNQAAGKGNSRGIVGLTTEELQSGLPSGFDPSIWGQKSKINNGFPYLLNNPPPK